MWRCTVCNYIWDADEAPLTCPNCEAAAAKFTRLSDKAIDTIERSRFANSLLMHLHGLMEQAIEIAEDGIDDNLDPACVKIFAEMLDQAEHVQQLVLLELQAHMATGRWG